MQVINCRRQHSMCRVNYLSTDSKTYTLLTSVHNDADNTDDANDYNRVIGIAQLKAFSSAKNRTKDFPVDVFQMYTSSKQCGSLVKCMQIEGHSVMHP